MTTTKDCKDFFQENEFYSTQYDKRSTMLAGILLSRDGDPVSIGVKSTAGMRVYNGKIVTWRVIGKKLSARLAVVIRREKGLLCTIPFPKIYYFFNPLREA